MPVQSITMSVDGKTFRTWALAMHALRAVFRVPVVTVGDVSGLPRVTSRLRFSGLRLLNEVGLAASRPELLHDPARHFAVLKYATAIAATDQFLLDGDIPLVDQHKRKVLSDDMGAGFSFVAARSLLGAGYFLDLNTAVRRGKVVNKGRSRKAPDYVALLRGGGLALVEAKGTQTRYYAPRQIQQGCLQLRPWAAARSDYPIRYRAAFGIELGIHGRDGTSRLFVGDPEESNDPSSLELGDDPGTAIISDHFGRAAAFVGDTELLERMDPEQPRRAGGGAMEREHIDGMNVVGSRLIVRSGASTAMLFVGIDEEVRNTAIEGSARSAADVAVTRAVSRSASRGPSEREWNEVEWEGEAAESREGRHGGLDRGHVRSGTAEQDPPSGDNQPDDPARPATVESDDGMVVRLTFEGPISSELAQRSDRSQRDGGA